MQREPVILVNCSASWHAQVRDHHPKCFLESTDHFILLYIGHEKRTSCANICWWLNAGFINLLPIYNGWRLDRLTETEPIPTFLNSQIFGKYSTISMSFCLKGWMDTWELTESGRGWQSLALWLGTAEAEWRQQVQSSWRRKPQGINDPGHQESIESRSFKTFETQEIIRRNGTLRIFDKLGRRMHTMARHNGTTLATDKLHLFNDYSTPQPLHGVDKFDKAGVLTDYQWIIASHK